MTKDEVIEAWRHLPGDTRILIQTPTGLANIEEYDERTVLSDKPPHRETAWVLTPWRADQ